MTQACSVYSQLLQLFPRRQFAQLVKQHQAGFNAKGFPCREQFVAMLFCQAAHLNSLREVCLGLAGCESPPKHLGILNAPKKSTLAYANAHRPWELYESVFMQLLTKAPGRDGHAQPAQVSSPAIRPRRRTWSFHALHLVFAPYALSSPNLNNPRPACPLR